MLAMPAMFVMPGISGKDGSCIELCIGLDMVIGACMVFGEGYGRPMCGAEY